MDFNIEFSLVGRDHLGWKEGLGDGGAWALGSCPAVSVPEERIHDNVLLLGSTSAPRQGMPHTVLYNLECLLSEKRKSWECVKVSTEQAGEERRWGNLEGGRE